MFYKIVELANAKKTGHLYVLVHFWPDKKAYGKPPVLINDFLMQLRPTSTQVVTDDRGYLRTVSGRWVRVGARVQDYPDDPWERETVDVDLVGGIKGNIEAYWRRAQARGEEGDHSAPAFRSIERDNKDPHGVLKPEVVALRGAEVEEVLPSPP